MKRLLSILAVFAIIQLIPAQVVEMGTCSENITTVEKFNITRYLGRWYENQKYPFIFENEGKCIYADYGLLKNDEISVYNFNINERTGKESSVNGTAKIVDDGKLKVKISSMPSFAGDYWILYTDYNSSAVVYSCNNFGNVINTKVVWILTRERKPQPQIVQQARKVIEQNGLSLDALNTTDQNGC